MKWLDERYTNIRPHIKKMNFGKLLKELNRAGNDRDILRIEEELTDKYWNALDETFSWKFVIERKGSDREISPKERIEPMRSLFNIGHAALDSICLRAINGANLDPYIGFLHRMKVTRSPLVDDFKGPYQWLVDKTIIQAIENETFNKYDFIRSDDRTIQLRPDSVKRLIEELDKTFSQLAKYKGRNHQWYVMIQIKAQELALYLTNNLKVLDFYRPEPYIEKLDSRELREKILRISYSDWKKMGYSHGSLHYLKKCASSNKPLKLTKQNAEKLDSMNMTG
jgi:CRISPR-associated protein Cas1